MYYVLLLFFFLKIVLSACIPISTNHTELEKFPLSPLSEEFAAQLYMELADKYIVLQYKSDIGKLLQNEGFKSLKNNPRKIIDASLGHITLDKLKPSADAYAASKGFSNNPPPFSLAGAPVNVSTPLHLSPDILHGFHPTRINSPNFHAPSSQWFYRPDNSLDPLNRLPSVDPAPKLSRSMSAQLVPEQLLRPRVLASPKNRIFHMVASKTKRNGKSGQPAVIAANSLLATAPLHAHSPPTSSSSSSASATTMATTTTTTTTTTTATATATATAVLMSSSTSLSTVSSIVTASTRTITAIDQGENTEQAGEIEEDLENEKELIQKEWGSKGDMVGKEHEREHEHEREVKCKSDDDANERKICENESENEADREERCHGDTMEEKKGTSLDLLNLNVFFLIFFMLSILFISPSSKYALTLYLFFFFFSPFFRMNSQLPDY